MIIYCDKEFEYWTPLKYTELKYLSTRIAPTAKLLASVSIMNGLLQSGLIKN
ncbi:hypothetical protein PIROE2DRAFT_9332 [Piromyces sp. E2]|nr:hypothetical protein PIROE2DRAFT_9332 [Piromyces sp. E2]|eukprot:OUM64025.1 hypothetical protein PIROE2DRAFT_9332 [Piromyces sp. E2]